MAKDTVVSGMRPTGRLHLGNYWGALRKKRLPVAEMGIAHKRERTLPPSARTFISLIRKRMRAIERQESTRAPAAQRSGRAPAI